MSELTEQLRTVLADRLKVLRSTRSGDARGVLVAWPVVIPAPDVRLSEIERSVLKAVYFGYGAVTGIAERFDLNPDIVDRTVSELQQRGLAAREPDGLVRVTDSGEAAVRVAVNTRSGREGTRGEPISDLEASQAVAGIPRGCRALAHQQTATDYEQLAYVPCAAVLSSDDETMAVEVHIGDSERSDVLERALLGAVVRRDAMLHALGLVVHAEQPVLKADVKRADFGQAGKESVCHARPVVEVIRGTEQHVEMLHKALREASRQVIIATPHIRGRADNQEFLCALRDALGRGLQVTVLYGLKPDRNNPDGCEDDEKAEECIKALDGHARLRFANVVKRNIHPNGDHSKVLICDEHWAVVTSFNWMSFPPHEETGLLVRDPSSVAELRRQLRLDQLGASSTREPRSRRHHVRRPGHYPFGDYSGDQWERDVD